MSENILKIFVPYLPARDSVHLCQDFVSRLIWRNCCSTIVERDDDGEVKLELLASSSVASDQKKMRFALKKGMLTSDGREINSKLFLEIWKSWLSDQSSLPNAVMLKGGQKNLVWKRVSTHRFEVAFPNKTDGFLSLLSHPRHGLGGEGLSWTTGVWKLRSWTEDQIELVSNDLHIDSEEFFYDKVILKAVANPETINFFVDDEAYLAMYPGHTLRVGAEWSETLVTRPLVDTVSPSIVPCPSSSLTGANWDFFIQCVHKISKQDKGYRRDLDTGPFPKGHLLRLNSLHSPKIIEAPAMAVKVVDPENTLGASLCNTLQLRLKEFGIEADFVVSSDVQGFDAYIDAIESEHPFDWLSSVSSIQKISNKKLSPIWETNYEAYIKSLRKKWQKLVADKQLVSLFIAPIMVVSNRQIDWRQCDLWLRFESVLPEEGVKQKEQLRDDALRAIGESMQMFAHDIQKPFAVMQAAMNLIEDKVDQPDEVVKLTKRFLPRIRQSIRSANNLIGDILEISSDAQLFTEAVPLVTVVDHVIKESFYLGENLDIELIYHFDSQRLLICDFDKLTRALANIVVNAKQAMNGSGQIWFESRDVPDDLVEFVIGNSNSYISPEASAQLFNRFYTNQKKGGTGLGLAIVEKIVIDHGGDIFCRSDRDRGVEFVMRLPVSSLMETTERPTLASSIRSGSSSDFGESRPKALASKNVDKPMNIWVIDDDPIYLAMFEEVATGVTKDQLQIKLTAYESASEAFDDLKDGNSPCLIVMDQSLGSSKVRGSEWIRRFRQEGFSGFICLHSSLDSLELEKVGFKAGADKVLPKPMTRQILDGLINEVEPQPNLPKFGRVVIVEDDPIFLDQWNEYTCSADRYSNPRKFLDQLESGGGCFDSVEFFIVDRYFRGETIDGCDLLEKIRECFGGSIPVVLFSSLKDRAVIDRFDGFIPKGSGDLGASLSRVLKR